MSRGDAGIAQTEPKTAETILLVEDDLGLQKQMRWALSPYTVEVAGDRREALGKLASLKGCKVVILDLGLPPDANGAGEGLHALEEILTSRPYTKVVIASGNVDRANAVRAVGNGAFDFISKPIDVEVLKLVLQRAHRMYELEEENRQLRAEPERPHAGLIFSSAPMAKVAQLIERVGPMSVNALIVGETGTGKEVVARALHDISPRKSNAFIAINCAAIPENLLESELFGHERGAFTGAVKRTHGKFELADKGTLFLDEIGDMPMALQSKLLRFLQDRRLERIGGRESISVDVRLICATNQRLEKLISEQKFREDLFYRINDVRIELPPLRERDGDVAVLGQHFLNMFNRLFYKRISGFTEAAWNAMETHKWPGNVRELESRVKRAVIVAEGKRIDAPDLDLQAGEANARSFDLKNEIDRLSKKLAREALAISDGNISKAAKLLGVSRPHLYTLLEH